MIRFLDGPASGETLSLRRAPVMLRAVRSRRGEWDALDQLDDVAKPTEIIVVYRVVGTPSPMFIRSSQRSLSGMWWNAEYRLWPDQPPDDVMRDNARWRSWCVALQQKEARDAAHVD